MQGGLKVHLVKMDPAMFAIVILSSVCKVAFGQTIPPRSPENLLNRNDHVKLLKLTPRWETDMQTKIHLKLRREGVKTSAYCHGHIVHKQSSKSRSNIARWVWDHIFIQVELSDNPNDTPFNGVYLSQEGNKFSCNGVWLG